MKALLHKLILVSALIALSACGSSDKSPTGSQQGGQQLSVSDSEAGNAWSAPFNAYQSSSQTASFSVEAAWQASILSGGTTLITTGTLTQTGQNSFSYSATPTDRMVVQLSNGERFEIQFQQFTGDFSGDAQNFLSRNHNLSFTLTGPTANITVSSQRTGINVVANLNGNLTLDGIEYNADLNMTGTTRFEVDNTGSEYNVDNTYTGTMVSATLSLTINETWVYNNVVASGLGNAENGIRTFNNSWTRNGNEFRFQNGRLQIAFRDGRPSDFNGGYWMAQGDLLANGTQIGQMEFGQEGNYLKTWVTANGQRTEMQSWRIQ